jgi:hypothetical protein
MITLEDEFPIICGGRYKLIYDGSIGILECCDLKKDFIRLKDPDSPWVFESNYATFSLYWDLIK